MIIIRLQGGLGNQMFQYAAAKALAVKNKTTVYVDLDLLQREIPGTTKRRFELMVFSFQPSFAGPSMLEKFRKPKGIRKWISRKTREQIYEEPRFQFDPAFFRIKSNALLSGYLQSEKYFKAVSDIIRDDFKIAYPLSAQTAGMATIIKSTNSVGIHIRRGDYVNNPTTGKIHGCTSLLYYQKALDIIAAKAGAMHLFVFSDDLEWSKTNFKTSCKITFADHNDEEHAYEDLYLMSTCKHNIIANSTFSWWAAWLNINPGKIVIAPARWFNESTADTKDLIPEEWIKVQ